jgi:hypothetical protein
MKTLVYLCVLFTVAACKPYSYDVKQVLKLAGDNRKELINVLEHYRQTGENEKYKAAEFLIGNMANKYSKQLPKDSYYFTILSKVDSLRSCKATTEEVDNFIKDHWQKAQMSSDTKLGYDFIYDYTIITSQYLINNIDLSFKVWKEKPWASHLNFGKFCEWILPYRVFDEPLQNWRQAFYNSLSWLDDTLQNSLDTKKACELVNQFFAKDFQFSEELNFIPLLGGEDLLKYRAGICEHRYLLITLAMRSVGIPVSIDLTPQICKTFIAHSWTVLLDNDGYTKAFNGGERKINIKIPNDQPIVTEQPLTVTKIYRYQFAPNRQSLIYDLPKEKIPDELYNPYVIDVTDEYKGMLQGNIVLNMNAKEKKNNKYAFLFVYNLANTHIAIASTRIENGQAIFNNVGKDGLYFVGTYDSDSVSMVGTPFIFSSNTDSLQYIKPNLKEKQYVKLYRKNFVKVTLIPFSYSMKGAQLQGANRPDFSDWQVIHTIDTVYYSFKEFEVTPVNAFRYYRYMPSDSGDVRMADITLYYHDNAGQKQIVRGRTFGYKSDPDSHDSAVFRYAFDDNIRTNFNAPQGSWVAIDAGKPVKLSEVRYLIRNHLNVIEPGDSYTLNYFNREWQEVSTKTASDYFIEFDSVPKQALLWVHNNTKGKEEKVFLYENGHQVFW